MNTQDFVTYEQAVKLNDLGFNWDCDFIYYLTYHNHNKPIFSRYETVRDYEAEKYWYAPTLSQAQKWLREVKEIYLFVTMEDSQYYWYIGKEFQIGNCKSYEEALSAGIDEALKKLI